MQNEFEAMSVHQQVGFLHDFFKRAQSFLKKRTTEFLGMRRMSDEEILANTEIYRAFLFAMDEGNKAALQTIYRKLNPTRIVTLPVSMNHQAILIFFHARLFLQHWPTIDNERLQTLARKALLALQSVNKAEADRMRSAVEFFEDSSTFRFSFHDKIFHLKLNKYTDLGFELKQDLDSAQRNFRPTAY